MNDLSHHAFALKPAATDGAAAAADMARARQRMRTILDEMQALVVPDAADRVTNLRDALDEFRSTISLLGQVKAGKTALTNALIGCVGLLPSDVNPWTSVVTSIHLNTPRPRARTRSSPSFPPTSGPRWSNAAESWAV